MAKKRSFALPAILVSAGVLAVLGGAYLGIHFAAADHLPINTVINGVEVGGVSPEQATATLYSAFESHSKGHIEVKAADKYVNVDLAEIEFAVDYPQTLAQAGGGAHTWNLVENLNQLFGGGEYSAIVTFNKQKLAQKIQDLAAQVDLEAVDALLEIEAKKPVVTPGSNGSKLDVAATAEAFEAGLLLTKSVEAVVVVAEPQITTAHAEHTATNVAVPAIAAPITVTVGDLGSFELSPDVIAATMSFQPKAGTLTPVFDERLLNEKIAKDLDKLGLKPPVDAKFSITGKSDAVPKIVADVPGTGID
ncbi:MAG: peptidoglycan binding domain-containing protein, partial [Propionibacteriaceae bacterium]|nr:peptidoglycan binding domain-containing protein [Propionibacteriaceae bacterium]